MKKFGLILLVLTFSLAFLSTFNNKESIVICTSLEQFRADALEEQLNQTFRDKNIIVMYMPTGKAAAKIYAEGKRTEVDILVAIETGYLNKIQNSLEDINGLSDIEYLDEFTVDKNHGKWVTWEKQAGAIIVNKKVLEKYGLKPPRTYQDLLKEEYRGLIAMPDPKSSGTGYFFYKSWVNSWGEDKALAYVDELYKNLKQFTESGSGPIKMLKQGEVAIGLGLTFQAVSEINDGQPFEIVFTEEGSPYSLTGTAMIEGRREKSGVREVFDFIINDFLKYDKENYSPETVYNDQKNLIPNYPQNIPYADMKGIQDNTEKERLLALWKY